MAFIGNQPYDIRLAHMVSQPYYHSDDICGSSFHGLATTLERYLKNYDFYGARDQVERCLDARQAEMRRRSYPDPAHNHAINVIRRLLNKIDNLIADVKTFWRLLPTTIVRYNEETGFTIIIDNIVFGGKINKRKKSCKKCSKKTKKSKTKKQKRMK